MSDKNRVLLLTDSLGCPREEINVKDTWTDKLIRDLTNYNMYFYTYCVRGLYSKKVPDEYIRDLNPDIVISQIGIVDASRRAMHYSLNRIIQHIPGISKCVNYFCSKHHYSITRLLNIHYASQNDLRTMYLNIIEKTTAKLIILAIAPCGSVLKGKTYDIENDINRYNKVAEALAATNSERVVFLDPYINTNPDDLFISDGHHLNENTNNTVYEKLKEVLISDL